MSEVHVEVRGLTMAFGAQVVQRDLGFAVRHAALALRRVKQNFALAFGYNLIVIPLAAMGRIPPWAAAIGMSASSAMVVLNALRLRSSADDSRSGRAA